MTTLSSILAREIRRTEASGGFQSVRSQESDTEQLNHNYYSLKCRSKGINNTKVLSS